MKEIRKAIDIAITYLFWFPICSIALWIWYCFEGNREYSLWDDEDF